MANLLGKTVLGIVVACTVHGVTFAQDVQQLFQEGVRLIRIGQPEDGLKKLQEVIQKDPSNEEAFDLVRTTDIRIFQMLLEQKGEYAKIAESILDRAKVGRAKLSRDEAQIEEVVQRALSGDFETREAAKNQLASDYAEFAVPALCKVLGDPNLDKQIDNAMLALYRIGHAAVLPLMEATKSPNAQLRSNAAASLVHIKDDRSGVAFARLANDPSEAVRFVAQRGLAALGLPAGADAVQLGVDQAHAYLVSGGVRDGDYSEVVWSWTPQGLKYTDVPAPLYHLELAKRRAHDAMRVDPTNTEAKSLLARSYLAQVAVIEDSLAANPDNPAMQALANETGRLRMVAEALGVNTLRMAVQESIAEGQSAAAIRAIQSLGGIEERGELQGSPLVGALDASDTRVAYAAALALAKAAEGGELPAADKVVAVLGNAVQEEAIRTVLFIDSNPMNLKTAKNASTNERGYWVDATASGKSAIADFYNNPSYDVVVVSDTLPDALPEDVVSLIRQRNAKAKIVLLTKSADAEAKFGNSVDGYLVVDQGTLSQEALLAKVNEVVDALDARRSRATDVAIAAGEALRDLARADVAIGGAAKSLADQLNREDAVAIPAANALGEGGGADQIGALQAAVAKADGSNDLRIAAAHAIGSIVARTGAKPAGMFDALVAVVEDQSQDMALRRAIVDALGKAPLAPGERARLVDLLDVIAASQTPSEG